MKTSKGKRHEGHRSWNFVFQVTKTLRSYKSGGGTRVHSVQPGQATPSRWSRQRLSGGKMMRVRQWWQWSAFPLVIFPPSITISSLSGMSAGLRLGLLGGFFEPKCATGRIHQPSYSFHPDRPSFPTHHFWSINLAFYCLVFSAHVNSILNPHQC